VFTDGSAKVRLISTIYVWPSWRPILPSPDREADSAVLDLAQGSSNAVASQDGTLRAGSVTNRTDFGRLRSRVGFAASWVMNQFQAAWMQRELGFARGHGANRLRPKESLIQQRGWPRQLPRALLSGPEKEISGGWRDHRGWVWFASQLWKLATVSASASGFKRFPLTRSLICSLLCSAVVIVELDVRAALAASVRVPTEVLNVPELDAGFHLLYELKVVEARTQFEARQKSHPQDPLGSASEAASYLFEECYRQGILTSEFFLDDKRFLGKIPVTPDPELRAAFFAADKQARDLAELRLKTNPDDPNALFAITLSVGMEADYASLIDRHQLKSLKLIREADKYAKKLLAVAPDAADAYLSLGIANYIIGSLPGKKKLFLSVAGIHGDKKKGIQQLEIAAEHGHYLRPFAKTLLAMVALREKKPEVARAQLSELVAEFPENPLFASELAKLNGSPASAIPPE
jgi:hypothetical protein